MSSAIGRPAQISLCSAGGMPCATQIFSFMARIVSDSMTSTVRTRPADVWTWICPPPLAALLTGFGAGSGPLAETNESPVLSIWSGWDLSSPVAVAGSAALA